jgi:hypothetical protein
MASKALDALRKAKRDAERAALPIQPTKAQSVAKQAKAQMGGTLADLIGQAKALEKAGCPADKLAELGRRIRTMQIALLAKAETDEAAPRPKRHKVRRTRPWQRRSVKRARHAEVKRAHHVEWDNMVRHNSR